MNPLNVSIFYIMLCLVVGYGGRNRKFGFWGYFFASMLLTPAMGILLLIASPVRSPDGRNR